MRFIMSITRTGDAKDVKEHTDMILAKEVLQKMVQEGHVFTNDILPFTELPFTYLDEINEYKKRFGADRVQKLLDHYKKTEFVREHAIRLSKEFLDATARNPITTQHIAVTHCGVGECSELVNRLTIELVKAGCKRAISTIVISNKGNLEGNYAHTFLIIGNDLGMSGRSLKSIAELNDSYILVDPKFKVVGYAKDILTLLAPYIKSYGYNQIEPQMLVVNPSQINATLIDENAKFISEMIKALPGYKQFVTAPCSTSKTLAGLKVESKPNTSQPASESKQQESKEVVNVEKVPDLDDPKTRQEIVTLLCKVYKSIQEYQQRVKEGSVVANGVKFGM